MPKSLIKVAWLAIPVTVLAGDFIFRWGGRLPANLWEAPSNLLATAGLSALVWWATSRLIGSSRRRWLWAAAVGLPAACLVASAWRFAAVSGHDPSATVMVYLWQEPVSSLRMIGARFSPGFGVGVALLAALWVLALGTWRTRDPSRVTKMSCVAAPIIWLFAASLWPAGMTVGKTPFTADFHLTHTLVDGATQIAGGRASGALGVGERAVPDDRPDQLDGPNVIVFIAESLRKDRMQLYGHDRQTTPRLVEFFDRYPDQVHRFERATSTSAFSHLSVPAILSGLHMAHSRERMHRA
ncbi:MAG: sulfatase-like hydrolase/transferase, partial [Persicimonas sp.]